MSAIFTSGTYFCYLNKCGYFFFGNNATDMIWHMALSSVSFHTYPFIMPVFAGAPLSGYNYLLDLIVYFISLIGIPSIITYFKILPIIWFIVITISAIRFGLTIHKSPWFIALFLMLFYFCGSFAYILTLMHSGTIWESSGIVAMQSLNMLSNIQFSFSLILFFETLIVIRKNEINFKSIIIFGLSIFFTFGLKFYGGILITFMIGLFLLLSVYKQKKTRVIQISKYGIIILLITIATIFLFYDPLSSLKTGSIFKFEPFSTVNPIIETHTLLYLPKLVSLRYGLLQGGVGIKFILIETFILVIYLFFDFGIRFFGLIYALYKGVTLKITKWEFVILNTIIFSILLNILFVQKGIWWNTVQFLYYGIFLSSIFTAQLLFELLNKKKFILTGIVLIILLLSIPTNIDQVHKFYSRNSMGYLPNDEIKALTFLKKQPYGVVFQPLYSPVITDSTANPAPLYAEYDNGYVAAFSEKPLYYANETQIKLTGVDYKERLEKIKKNDCSVLNSVTYLYIVSRYHDDFYHNCIQWNSKFKIIFKNESVQIYQKIKV